MLQDDWLLRTLRELAALVARALRLGKSGAVDEAQQLIDEAWSRQVGMPRRMADRLDPKTLASALGPVRRQVAIELLLGEAQLLELGGAAERARERRARADGLR